MTGYPFQQMKNRRTWRYRIVLCVRRMPLGTRDSVILLFISWLVCAISLVAQAQEVKRFDLALKGGELPKEHRLIKVKQGDSVELHWTSDRSVSLHLHGYDIMIVVKAGEPTVTTLTARLAGRFPLERLQDKAAHQHGGKVLYFEAHP